MSTFINPTELDLKEETVVCINRVSKATTGGRSMRFNSLVVVDIFLSYQLAFLTPGINPFRAISLKQILQRPNFLYTE